MILPDPCFVTANGIAMAVNAGGAGPPIVLLHGFPELAYSWRHLVALLRASGWRTIAPDLRGFGATGPQGDVATYSMRNLAHDVIGLLDALGIGKAIVVGHDFGGALAWTLARDHADRVAGVVSLNTPYTRRAPADLVRTMLTRRGPIHYMVAFQPRGVAERLLERDVAGVFRALMRRPALSLAHFNAAEPRLRALPVTLFTGEPAVMGEPFLSDAELEVYIDAFTLTGFGGGLNWYRNLRRNWEDTADRRDHVAVPALMISAADDFFLPPETARGMEKHVPDLERQLIPDCGHWTMQERPDAAASLILDWLERRMRPVLSDDDRQEPRRRA